MAASKLAILIQNLRSYPASRESNIELLILVSDFMGKSMLKMLKGISMKCMECFNEGKKKKDRSYISWVVMIKSLPVPNYLILCTSLMDSMLI